MINLASTEQLSAVPLTPRFLKVRKLINSVLPASAFSIEELTHAYNQTRIDYIVPMPMTAARLQEYIDAYDVDLSASVVVVDQATSNILGLGMLGLRDCHSWVTRLGVLPAARGRQIGRVIMDELIRRARQGGATHVWLEVIQGNEPAHNLFKKLKFRKTRELIVSRRAPAPVEPLEQVLIKNLTKPQMMELLNSQLTRPNWLNGTETFQKSTQLHGRLYSFTDDSQGWVIYEESALQLKRVTAGVLNGDEGHVTAAVLRQLHSSYPHIDAVYENIAEQDPRWQGYQEAGYFESFRRVEMVKKL